MTDKNLENRPEMKPQSDAATSSDAKAEPSEKAEEPMEKGKKETHRTGERICNALKKASDVTKRKTGSWLNATCKAIEELAGNIAKKTERAAEEDRKASSAGKKGKAPASEKPSASKSTAPQSDSTGARSTPAKKAATKKTSAKKTATKKTARKRTATKKTTARKSSTKKTATKKSTATPKKTPADKTAAEAPPSNPSEKPGGV